MVAVDRLLWHARAVASASRVSPHTIKADREDQSEGKEGYNPVQQTASQRTVPVMT